MKLRKEYLQLIKKNNSADYVTKLTYIDPYVLWCFKRIYRPAICFAIYYKSVVWYKLNQLNEMILGNACVLYTVRKVLIKWGLNIWFYSTEFTMNNCSRIPFSGLFYTMQRILLAYMLRLQIERRKHKQ